MLLDNAFQDLVGTGNLIRTDDARSLLSIELTASFVSWTWLNRVVRATLFQAWVRTITFAHVILAFGYTWKIGSGGSDVGVFLGTTAGNQSFLTVTPGSCCWERMKNPDRTPQVSIEYLAVRDCNLESIYVPVIG